MFQYFILFEMIWIFSEFLSFNLIFKFTKICTVLHGCFQDIIIPVQFTKTTMWDSHPQVHHYIELCCFSPFPADFSWWQEYWDNQTSSSDTIWGLKLYHSHVCGRGEPTGPRSTRCEASLSHPPLVPIKVTLLQREQVSQVGRSDAVAADVHGLRSMGQREERTDRRHRRERFQERERRKGQREGEKCCLDEGEARLTKRGDTKRRRSVGHLSPTEKLRLVFPEAPRSSPQKGTSPTLGTTKYVTS